MTFDRVAKSAGMSLLASSAPEHRESDPKQRVNRKFRGRSVRRETAVQSGRSLRSTLAIAAMVFQLRVVTDTP
jgi:hypothetical protein